MMLLPHSVVLCFHLPGISSLYLYHRYPLFVSFISLGFTSTTPSAFLYLLHVNLSGKFNPANRMSLFHTCPHLFPFLIAFSSFSSLDPLRNKHSLA